MSGRPRAPGVGARPGTVPTVAAVLAALVVAALVIVTLLIVVGRSGGGDADSPAPTTAGALVANATVEYVVDGDTVDLLVDGRSERVRLIGIDTPESVDRDRPVECYGPEASAYTRELLPAGTPVRIERDVEPRDDYGRLLGYVYRAADGLFVNLEVVWQGYATPLSIEPNTAHADTIVAAARSAERAGRGLWGACGDRVTSPG